MKTTTFKLRKETRPLTNYEQNVLLPILIKGLKMKKGKENAVKANQILNGLKNNGLKISLRSFQRIINYIRIHDLIEGLMGSYEGYYIANSELELIDYERCLLSKEMAIRDVRMSIKRQRYTLFPDFTPRKIHLF